VWLTHRHSALGSAELLPLQSGRVAFKVPPFLVPPMISVLRSAVDQRANFDIERMELVRYSFGGVLAPRRVCIASLAGWAHPAHVCTGKDIGQRTSDDLHTGRSRSFRCSACRASLRTPAMCAARPAPPCRLSGAAGVQRRRAAGSCVAPALGPRVAQRASPAAGEAVWPAGLSLRRRSRCMLRSAVSVVGAPHSHRLRALPGAERRTPAVMFGWRMPAGVARAQDDFVDASHSRRLHANCASPCKCFVPFEVRAAAPACV
jgi:hypothetical protein